MRTIKYNQAIVTAANQQLAAGRVVCVICLKATATDPHHWLFKQNENVDPDIQDDPRNLVLLCHADHDKFGQTPVAFNAAYLFKVYIAGDNIRYWLSDLWIHQRMTSMKAIPDLERLGELHQGATAQETIARMKRIYQ